MAISQTTRLSVYRWTAGTDEFTREQLDTSHANFETRIGTFYSNTIALRPTTDLNTTYARSFYLATDQNVPVGILYYCTGTAWVAVNSFAAPGAVTPGATASAGTATTLARSDHQHSLLPFATGTSAVNTSSSAGTDSTFSRGDHVHAIANGAVTAGKIAAGAINASNIFTTGVVDTTAIADNAVTRPKIVETERIPVGTIIPYVGLTAPTGWMMCEGGQVAASSDLGVLLGTRYNTGGETVGNVRVPDLRNRVARGGTSAGAWTLPATGGAASVSLSLANLPSHNHALGSLSVANGGSHSHGAGTLTTNEHSLSHTHTMSHTHTLSATASGSTTGVPLGSFGPQGAWNGYGWAYRSGTGDHNISSASGNTGNASYSLMEKYSGSWTTSSPSTNTSGSMSSNALHQHTVSGTTSTDGSHTHGITGTVSDAGSGSSFSVVPSYAGTSFIIKL
jgi:microcystin-dependent protein